MLNLYSYFDKPIELEQREYARWTLDKDEIWVYVNNMAYMFALENYPESLEIIYKGIGSLHNFEIYVNADRDKAYIMPYGKGKLDQYNVTLLIDDGYLIGSYTHFGHVKEFYRDRTRVQKMAQLKDAITLGLTKLAEAELND